MKTPSIALLLTLTLPGFGGTNRFTLDVISQSPPDTNISRVQWHPYGHEVTYLRPVIQSGRTNNALFAHDIATGKERIVFDPPIPSPATNSSWLSLASYQWSPAGDALLVTGSNDLWLVFVATRGITRLTYDRETEHVPSFSPDGQRVAFVKRNNLFVVDAKSRRQRQLTTDGSELILNGKLNWVYGEEFSHLTGTDRAYEWSPDGKKIVFLQLDERCVPEYPITDFLRAHPSVLRQRYPKAGDTNPVPRVAVVSAVGSRRSLQLMPLSPNIEYVLPEFSWTPDSQSAAVMTLNRAQNELTVHLWNPAHGKSSVLLNEVQPCWINVFEPPRFLKDGQHFVWLSERDGWFHCYLYRRDGFLERRLTRGHWMIEPNFSQRWSGRPFEIDAVEQWLYFSATERDPRERHICRVRLDGTGFERISKEPGTHFQKLAPTGSHFLENFSSLDTPPSIRLCRADGTQVSTLDQREDRWRDFAAAQTEFHEVSAPNVPRLYGALTKPADFNPGKRYPVIVHLYGGPHAQLVRNHSGLVTPRHHLLAQEGFLVWSLDGRGSWGRGHDWETTVFKNLGTNELADQLAGVAYLKTLPFVDPNRFGIWGWSYGGYMTLYALTHAPDVFRCGIAGAPVTDWKFYDTIYTERYMRTPKENPSGYKSSSPLAAADQLKARLLIIHGTADDNVHLQNTMSFIDALVKAGRPHEIQIQPGQMHGFTGAPANQFLTQQIVDFFRRNL